MARIAYVNGRYVPLHSKCIDIEDRGYQFADGIYEVVKAVGGEPKDLDRHFDRLERSLAELSISPPMSRMALRLVVLRLLKRNRLRRAIVYIQISRGTAPRSHPFPKQVRPNLVMTVRSAPLPSVGEWGKGVGVISLADERWARCDVKSISLLPNVLAKQRATEAGCREAWLLDRDGYVTEGSSSNAYIVDREGRLVTHPKNNEILGGITRSVLLELAARLGIEVVERRFTIEEAYQAREAFLTSTSSLVLPVTKVDYRVIGNGHPGVVTQELQDRYVAFEQMSDVYPASNAQLAAYN